MTERPCPQCDEPIEPGQRLACPHPVLHPIDRKALAELRRRDRKKPRDRNGFIMLAPK